MPHRSARTHGEQHVRTPCELDVMANKVRISKGRARNGPVSKFCTIDAIIVMGLTILLLGIICLSQGESVGQGLTADLSQVGPGWKGCRHLHDCRRCLLIANANTSRCNKNRQDLEKDLSGRWADALEFGD